MEVTIECASISNHEPRDPRPLCADYQKYVCGRIVTARCIADVAAQVLHATTGRAVRLGLRFGCGQAPAKGGSELRRTLERPPESMLRCASAPPSPTAVKFIQLSAEKLRIYCGAT